MRYFKRLISVKLGNRRQAADVAAAMAERLQAWPGEAYWRGACRDAVRTYGAEGDHAAALALSYKLARQDKNPAALRQLAFDLKNAGGYAETIAFLDAHDQKIGREADMIALRASCMYEEGRKQEAQSLLEKTVSKAPDNSAARHTLGCILLNEGQDAAAYQIYLQLEARDAQRAADLKFRIEEKDPV